MSEPNMMLWVDTETTGLLADPIDPTALEVSWMITDRAGRQLTPLRHRYSLITLREPDSSMLHAPSTGTGDNAGVIGWYSETDLMTDYPHEAVRTMHGENGLVDEFVTMGERAAAAGQPPPRLLVHWEALEALYRDDLETAGWSGLDDRGVILAGGGITHYEGRFLPTHMPRLFGDRRFHYALADTSTVVRTLHARCPQLPKRPDDVIAWGRTNVVDSTPWWDITVDGDEFAAPLPDEHTEHGEPTPPGWTWAQLERDNHRAHVGVARAVMAYRLYPHAVRAHL